MAGPTKQRPPPAFVHYTFGAAPDPSFTQTTLSALNPNPELLVPSPSNPSQKIRPSSATSLLDMDLVPFFPARTPVLPIESSESVAMPSFSSAPSGPVVSHSPSVDAQWTKVTKGKKGTQISSKGKTNANSLAAQPDASSLGGEDIEMNTALQERFTPGKFHKRDLRNDTMKQEVTKFRSNYIEQYLKDSSLPADPRSWLAAPEFPTPEEAQDVNEPWMTVDPADGCVVMRGNQIKGARASKDEYLQAHYEMLREDTVRPLRETISWVKNNPDSREDQRQFGGNMGLYEKVKITAMTFSVRGLAIRVAFSLGKVGKNIRWEQSKRLITGSLVALSPSQDMFKTKCIIAVVAARPLVGLQSNPPEIDLFFARPEDIEIDPQMEFVMVEERASFFEATRHTMLALQKMMGESFPLQEHLVEVLKDVEPPQYLQNQPKLDLTTAMSPKNGGEGLENVDVINHWPTDPKTTLDKSQQKALHHILTKRLATVQGPPGTGKTHVSVMALKIMLQNWRIGDPPIIIACQTNHALDQLLRHVSEFEPHFARLGGRSKETGIIKERTLFNLKQGKRINFPHGMRGPARTNMDALSKDICLALSPIELGKGLMDHNLLRKLGLLTAAQCESLEKGDSQWTTAHADSEEFPLKTWGGKQIVENKRDLHRDNFGFEFEEVDLEFEQLKELEAENNAPDDAEQDYESLRGAAISLCDAYVGRPATLTDDEIKRMLLGQDDMWKINSRFRGAVYNYLLGQAKIILLGFLRSKAQAYYLHAAKFKAGGWEHDQIILRSQKIIGMTTTGLSKYRALVAALKPKIVLIEEAAETMEAPVISACVPSLEHLILVGDHKQLRPQCAVKDLMTDPFNLNVSLFERMVENEVEMSMLKRQRRMIPEVRRLLKPIYGSSIFDHPSMKDESVRPPVPGMGGVNSLFFTHYWPETMDEQMSSTNQMEADMIVGFFDYLCLNGMTEKQITVLTFYNGQRKLLLRKLRQHPNLGSRIFKVVTVDSYQGEENDVILLSLVRSNPDGKIGFLGVENRICVALSRAKRGFYLFGNGELLAGESKIWANVVSIMAGKKGDVPAAAPKCRIVFNFPLVCSNHARKTWIKDGSDFEVTYGGCDKPCGAVLACGHPCLLTCHPFEHDMIECQESCVRALPCGHPCKAACGDRCTCLICNMRYEKRSAVWDKSVGSGQEMWKACPDGGAKQDDAVLRKKLMELDLAAAAASAQGDHDLRDRYLLDQAVGIKTHENPAIEAARAKAASPVVTAPALTSSSGIDRNSASQNGVSGSGSLAPLKIKNRIVSKGMFSLEKGFISFEDLALSGERKSTPPTTPSPVKALSPLKVAPSFNTIVIKTPTKNTKTALNKTATGPAKSSTSAKTVTTAVKRPSAPGKPIAQTNRKSEQLIDFD
ncbi:P-loop containing nucleoside triphosphate hydrolase protein [Tothia fuscella]|uniref:P-loop containing nucleoside triphosphate hydrolase protein n=1 Tax=Tothia fuscella TaxID=1048955 RepID=A0A9P4NTL6_9PEZI|nr:P-loop containing nucleoside triphosphate hydrolase protein [Tothia fuscella]